MTTWDSQSINTLRSMRESGRLSSEIATALHRSEKSVHDKLHALGLTKDGQRYALKVRAERAGDALKAVEVERGIDALNSYAIGYILGVLCGDGFISEQKRGGVVLGLGVRSKTFAEKFATCLSAVSPDNVLIRVFDYTYTAGASTIKTPEREVVRKENTYTSWNVTCCSRGVANFFKSLKKRFLSGETLDPQMARGALDGLFDSEGYFISTLKYAGLSMTNHFVIGWISAYLNTYGVDHKVYKSKTGYESKVSIHRHAAVKKFCALVRFSVEHREKMRLQILEG